MNLNREWWDERAALHGEDAVYATEKFLAGQSTLDSLDHKVTGDVSGLDLVHLQCHTGMDTLSWLRAGARHVTGVDFSEVAVEKAAGTARAAGLADQADFVAADVLNLPDRLHARYDLCFASIGVFSWIGDLARWMQQAAATLRPGGTLVVIELHPLYLMADSVEPLNLDFPYFDDGPHVFDDQAGSYAAPEAATRHNTTVEHGHSLGEYVTAAVAAGLVIEHLGEHTAVETDGHRGLLSRDDDGLVRWRHTGQLLPILFSLRARKPQRLIDPLTRSLRASS